MGCSFTEGVGCWDMSITPTNLSRHDKKEYVKYISNPLNKKRFHENSWPNIVGKELGFDKVINIGTGGDGISSQLKRFVDIILDNSEYKLYDISIIFLIPETSRFSLYSDFNVFSFGVNNSKSLSWMEIMMDPVYDSFLEGIFYLKLFREMCKSNDYEYYLFPLQHKEGNFISKHFKDTRFLNIHMDANQIEDEASYHSPICDHWNEKGYKLVASNIINALISFDNNIQQSIKSDFDWEWLGGPNDIWRNKFADFLI